MKARHNEFCMFDLGPLRYFLEIEVSSTSNGFFISYRRSISKILLGVALSDKRIVETPMEPTSTFVSTSAPTSLHRNLYLVVGFMSTVSIPHLAFPCCATP